MGDKHNLKKRRFSLVVLAILIAFILIVLYIYKIDKKDTLEKYKDSISWLVDKNAVSGDLASKDKEELQAEVNKKLLDGMINISMNLNSVFENGTSEGNLMIVNEKINNYPQVVQIYEDKSGEMIYQSGLIPVGSKIEKAVLIKNLKKGTYSCTAYFNSVNESNGEFVGTAGAKITITVEK